MANLDGSSIPVDLGAGVTLVAPACWARPNAHRSCSVGGQMKTSATPALTDALAAAGLEQVHGVQIAATEVPTIAWMCAGRTTRA